MRHLLGPVNVRVVVSATAFGMIDRTCRTDDDGLETGGILLGHQHQDGRLTVTSAGDPGPRAERTQGSFRRDPEHAQTLATSAYAADRSIWLGDWHTHPDGPTHPSELDLRSYLDVVRDPSAGFGLFLALIVIPEPSGPVLYPWAVTSRAAAPMGLWVARQTQPLPPQRE
jgi:integrative and conjugative element protein (TIGR02256 family)